MEERAEVTITVDVCAGRGPNWRYQVTPLPMTTAKRKGWRKGYPPPEKELMAHADVPGTEEDLELRILNPSDRTCELPKGTALGELVVVPVQPTWMVAETKKIFEKVTAVKSAQTTATTSGAESTSTFKFPEGFPDLLKHLVTEAVTETEEARKKLAEIMMDHEEAFSLNGEFGFIDNFEHEIPTGDAIPIKQSPYRLPLWGPETVGKCLDEMINAKVAVKCRPGEETDWASPVVLVKKKDGSVRFCIDYRKLNKVTQKSVHPIPNVATIFDILGRTSLFRTGTGQSR